MHSRPSHPSFGDCSDGRGGHGYRRDPLAVSGSGSRGRDPGPSLRSESNPGARIGPGLERLKLLLDNCLSPRLVDTLHETISDVVHVAALGLHAAADSALLQAAEEEGRVLVLVTLDGDFSALLAHARLGAPSVIYMRSQGLVAPAAQAVAIVDALNAYADELLAGAIVTIRDGQMACRRLPLP